jgi:hypothetical protein
MSWKRPDLLVSPWDARPELLESVDNNGVQVVVHVPKIQSVSIGSAGGNNRTILSTLRAHEKYNSKSKRAEETV